MTCMKNQSFTGSFEKVQAIDDDRDRGIGWRLIEINLTRELDWLYYYKDWKIWTERYEISDRDGLYKSREESVIGKQQWEKEKTIRLQTNLVNEYLEIQASLLTFVTCLHTYINRKKQSK